MEVEILQQPTMIEQQFQEQQPQHTTPMKVKDIQEKMIHESSPDQSDHSTITSTTQQQTNMMSETQEDNTIQTFPQLFCYEHKSPIILVCQKKNCQQRPFLCARCVSGNLSHMNAHDPFIMYEDFVQYLKTLDSTTDKQISNNIANTTNIDTTITTSENQENQKFTITENEIQTFQQNQEKQIEIFTEKMAEFKSMYEQNFDQFMSNMKQVMMEQTKILQRNYEKMNYMKQIDFEMEAEIPNFFEIKQNCMKLTDAKEMEQYLIQVLRRKQQWQSASDNVKTIGSQTMKFYEDSIFKQIQNQPSFQNLEISAQTWKQELTYTEENFQIKLDKVSEIKLMTNSMLKPEIQLLIDLAEKTISSEEFDEMLTTFMKLYSMQYIDFDFSQATLPSFEYIGKMLHIFKSMTKLNYLGMSLYGCGMNDKQIEKITESMSLMKNISQFIINVGSNPITQTGMVCLSSSLREMDQLKHLKFGYTNNKAKCQGLMIFAESLSNMQMLESLEVDFSGFSQKRNNIKDQGFVKFMQVLSSLKMLKKVHLDFGYNQITDEGLFEMCNSIKQMPYLNDFYINLNKCAITSERAMYKLGKMLGKMTIERIHINLNSNQIGDNGCYKFVMGMKQAMYTKYLKLNFRNVGLTNEKGVEMRNELMANTNFKTMEFFF